MLKKFLVASLVVVLFHHACLPGLQAQSSTPQNSQTVELKEKVSKWGAGKKVTVKMTDGNTYKGPITQVTDDGFVISDESRGRDVSASYAGVQSVKSQRSRLFKTLLGVGIVVLILGLVMGISCAASEGECTG